jgi:hypothetical protein
MRSTLSSQGGVGTWHSELDTMREEASTRGVIKLMSIIALDTLDGATKLRGHVGKEVGEGE